MNPKQLNKKVCDFASYSLKIEASDNHFTKTPESINDSYRCCDFVTNSLDAVTFDTHSHEATEEVTNSLCCRRTMKQQHLSMVSKKYLILSLIQLRL